MWPACQLCGIVIMRVKEQRAPEHSLEIERWTMNWLKLTSRILRLTAMTMKTHGRKFGRSISKKVINMTIDDTNTIWKCPTCSKRFTATVRQVIESCGEFYCSCEIEDCLICEAEIPLNNSELHLMNVDEIPEVH